MVNIEKTFRKIANDIESNKCKLGNCPCQMNCDVFTKEECIDRIMHYLKSFVVEEVEEYEAEWEYWDGWMSNHDKRIDDATCSKCGYKHPTIKFVNPDWLSDYCPNCRSKMKKK